MNGLTLADEVKAHIASAISDRTVYAGAVPNGALPPRYVVVWASEGSEESTRSTQTVNVQTPALWVTSVSRNTNPYQAAREAGADAAAVRAALRNWRPQDRWSVTHDVSQPARRDESIDDTTFMAVEQFSLRSSI